MSEVGGRSPSPDVDLSSEGDLPAAWSPEELAHQALERLPPWLRRPMTRLLEGWLGRIALSSAESGVRIEIFDRSMTIAAQFFTSVFPILILFASWVGNVRTDSIAEAIDMPEASQSVLDQAVQASASTGFGLVGALIVLASATSLSRALTRAYAAIWQLPRPRSTMRSAWRWLAVVVALALSLFVVRALSQFAAAVPPGDVWERVVAFACDLAIITFVPWLLLSGAVRLRLLLPAAVLFATLMLFVRPASAVWLPRALEASAERYGSIGVAFTYLAWLYVVAFCVLLTAVFGQVIAVDRGWLGTWLRGEREPGGDGAHGRPGRRWIGRFTRAG
ncbi:MAG TPA: YhjD/YihY/BrkB family envelope integrity protein [Nocardioides sp.]|nr:YhjD/YihY/BrkB family envelope integrity protein [Nocardioides sp.]